MYKYIAHLALVMTLLALPNSRAVFGQANAVVASAAAKRIVEIAGRTATRYCIPGHTVVVNSEYEAVKLRDEEFGQIVALALSREKTGVGRNTFLRVEDCEDAQVRIDEIRIVELPEGNKQASIHMSFLNPSTGHWEGNTVHGIPLPAQEPDTPRTQSVAFQTPLAAQRIPLPSSELPETTAKVYSTNESPDGGFGVQILDGSGQPLPLTRSPGLQLFFVSGLSDGDKFQIRLTNEYKYSGAARVTLDGVPRYRESGITYFDFLEPASEAQTGVLDLKGRQVDKTGVEQFLVLKRSDQEPDLQQNIEVIFHFAAENPSIIADLDTESPSHRGEFMVGYGEVIQAPVEHKQMFIGKPRESIRLAFRSEPP